MLGVFPNKAYINIASKVTSEYTYIVGKGFTSSR